MSTEHEDDTFGLCPGCHKPGNHFNLHSENWAACSTCKTMWNVGNNLLESWREETPEIWTRNWRLVENYTPVEPFYWPWVCTQCHRKSPKSKTGWHKFSEDGAAWTTLCPRCKADWNLEELPF